jgi:CBS-domain-containing membrane protein
VIAAEAMTPNPVAIPFRTVVRDTLALLRKHHLHNLPIVDKDILPADTISVVDIIGRIALNPDPMMLANARM